MEKISIEKMENLSGGKFWGSDVSCGEPWYWPDGGCMIYCTYSYYIFWIDFKGDGDWRECD